MERFKEKKIAPDVWRILHIHVSDTLRPIRKDLVFPKFQPLDDGATWQRKEEAVVCYAEKGPAPLISL